MNLEVSEIIPLITKKLEVVFEFIKRYRVILFIVGIALVYSFLVSRINSLSNQQPSDSDISAQLKSLSTPRIDEETVNKINQLQDNSVQVKALFNEARKNPFSE